MDITEAEDPEDFTEEELTLIAESEAELAAATALAAEALGRGNLTPAEDALVTLYLALQARDTADAVAAAIDADAEAAGMFLLIEEELIEGYYLTHGDPISVHWSEADADSALIELQKQNPSMVYKVLPVKIGARP